MNTDPAGWAKILIAADESSPPLLLEGLLRDAGYVNIRNTTDLRAVLTLVAELQPDLLCLDLRMPHREGVQVIEDLRHQRPARTYLPILVVAGEATPEARRRTLAAGANDFLTQPVDRLELLLRARNLLETRRLHRVLQTERASLNRVQSAALEAAADAILITDRDGTIQWVNRAFSALTGYAPEEVVGRSPRRLQSGQHEPEFYRRLWDTILAGAVWRGEIVNRYKDGRLATEAMTITPVRGDEGAITHFIAIKQEVTAAKDAERSRARLAAVLEASPDFVAMADPRGRVLSLNAAARRMLDVPDDLDPSLVTIAGSHPPWAADLVLREGISTALREGVWKGETAFLSRSGRLIPVSQIILAHKAPDGRVEFLSTVASDITERKKVGQALAKALAFHTTLVTAAPVGIVTYRLTGECVSCNDTAAAIVGATAEQLKSQNFRTLDPWKASGLIDLAERAITTRQPQASEFQIHTTFGKDVCVMGRCTVFRAGDEDLLLVILGDVTEQQRVAQALRAEEAFKSAIIRSAAEGLCVWHEIPEPPHVAFTLWNDRMTEITGYTMEEINRLGWYQTVYPDPEARARAAARMAQMREGKSLHHEEWDITRADGTTRLVSISTSVLPTEDGTAHVLALMDDVTERKRAEEAVRQSEASLRAIADNAPFGIAVIQDECRVFANRQAARLLGYTVEELAQFSIVDLVHPDYRATMLEKYRRRLAGEAGLETAEYMVLAKDGRTIAVKGTFATTTWNGQAALMLFSEDITERKRAEEESRRQHELAAQNEKLAAMSTLLAGVAHELNNPLTVVVGRAMLLRTQVHDEALARHTTQIEEAAARCARIVKNFLAVARQHPPEREPSSLNLIVRDAVEILAYPLRVDGVELRLELAEDLPEFQADAHQLGQVVINLVSNAHHAVRGAETRRITVTTRHEAPRGFVSLAVADTGPGIPPDIERRIFEPFFTTKPIGQGTGLGLALCRGITEEHGGALRVDGRPGRGARFVVELPAQPAPEPASGPEAPGAPSPIPPCRILVADDEPEVASLVAEVLAGDHHMVETVTSGRAALERLAARSYDVIVSDIRMPDLDGIAFYRALEQRQPAACARLIFLTGDTLDPVLGEFLRSSGRPCVVKPFIPEQLRRAMAQVLPPGPAGAPDGRGAAPPPPSR